MTEDPDPTATEVVNALRSAPGALARETLARFILANESKIKSVARQRVWYAPQQVCDSDEIFSTLLRRLDRYVVDRRLQLDSIEQLWSLIFSIAETAIVSKLRLVARLKALQKEEGPSLQTVLDLFTQCVDDDEAASLIAEILLVVCDDSDRHIVGLRLRGASHQVIAHFLRMDVQTVRKRWSNVLIRLREHFSRK